MEFIGWASLPGMEIVMTLRLAFGNDMCFPLFVE
jgi:hypothetical protein